jgi:hypothetical protein
VEKTILLERIEQCRAEMITLSHSHGLTSEAVVTYSKQLDILINEYQNYKKASA